MLLIQCDNKIKLEDNSIYVLISKLTLLVRDLAFMLPVKYLMTRCVLVPVVRNIKYARNKYMLNKCIITV